MAEEHRTRVVIEGDSSSYAAATARGSRSSEEFRRIVENTGNATPHWGLVTSNTTSISPANASPAIPYARKRHSAR